jgi:hypothetical protein
MTEFVARGKIGSFLADGEADGHQFRGSDLDCVFVKGAADGDSVAEMGGNFFLRLERVHQAVGDSLKASSALQALVTRTPDQEPVFEGLVCPARATVAMEKIAPAKKSARIMIELISTLGIDSRS